MSYPLFDKSLERENDDLLDTLAHLSGAATLVYGAFKFQEVLTDVMTESPTLTALLGVGLLAENLRDYGKCVKENSF